MDSEGALWIDPALRARVEAIADELTRRNETLATVECALGGALGHLFTNVVGASSWYLGGTAAYSATAKERLLGLEASAFGEHGAVSAHAAARMADALRQRLGATWTLAETGLTGPRGRHRSAKAPGTLFLCLAGPLGEAESRAVETGLDDRLANKRAFLTAAVTLLHEHISRDVEARVV